jgi:protein ImuA
MFFICSIFFPMLFDQATNSPRVEVRLRKPAQLDDLRQLLAGPLPQSGSGKFFSFGLPTLDKHLPRQGISLARVHEIHAASALDLPSALGFLTAVLVSLPVEGPIFIITSAQGLASFGQLHGHGLQAFGLDPSRITLVEARKETDGFWALEESLRSGAASVVAGLIAQSFDLKKSQRLSLAAREAGRPLLLLRPPKAAVASAAETRWRIAAAPCHHDSSGALAAWRWRVKLERCRNGSTGEFVLEWFHASHRFGLAAPLADPALPDSAGLVQPRLA